MAHPIPHPADSLPEPPRNFAELKKLVAGGENQFVEFKRRVVNGEKIAREAVAFANAQGGLLILGVEDNLTIPGLKNPDEDEFVLDRALQRSCTPAIKHRRYRLAVADDAFVVVYVVEHGTDRPYTVAEDGEPQAYVRVRDRAVQASREMREVMRQRKKERQFQFQYGDKERLLMQHLSTKGHISLLQFAQLAQVPARQAGRTLVLLTLAGVLNIEATEAGDRFTAKDGLEISK